MRDLSTVRGYIPQLQANDMDVLLLNIHESPGRDLLDQFGFEFTPTYLIYDSTGNQLDKTNQLPPVDEILQSVE